MELNRRTFLKTAAGAVAATCAMAGMASVALADEPPADAEGEAPEGEGGAPDMGGTSSSSSSSIEIADWKVAPDPVSDFVAEYDCDVVVAGCGFAGLACARWCAEQGMNTIVVESQQEESFAMVGNEFASLNSDILQERGVEYIDPVDFYQNFMKITSNQPNPTLIMKFAQNSGEATNWYLQSLTDEDFDTMTTAFFPKTEHQMDELSGIKFWGSVCSFYGGCNQTKIANYNIDLAKEAGATFLFGTEAYYIIMEDGAVAGMVALTDDGFIKINSKYAVCACGGFGGNQDMMQYFMSDMYNALVEGESLTCMDYRTGRGVQMAYWAGAHLETTPVGGMNMKGLAVPGKMNVLPQALWVDEYGKRFCNEYYPTSEQRGFQNIFQTRKTKWAVVDDNFTEYRQYTMPQHAGFEATEDNIQALRDSLDEAYANYKGEAPEEEEEEDMGMMGGPMTDNSFIADDTLEGLAAQMGYDEETTAAFLQQIADWNQYCADGVDQQFGRDSKVLFPVDTPPYYAVQFDPELGETMTTMGGILTNGEQNAIDANYEPIPGLYVSGNDCGRRFSYEYVTPIPGCSLGFAITLGRECGKSIVADFQG